MDDFDGFFDQFGQPRKRGKERREFVARLLGTASEPEQAAPVDEPPTPAGVLRIRSEIAAEFEDQNFVAVPGASRRLSFTLARQMGIAVEYMPITGNVEIGDPDGDEDANG